MPQIVDNFPPRPFLRRRQRQQARRLGALVEVLENRILLSSTLIPVSNPGSLIYDATRNELDIISGSAIQRYDVASGTMLAPWNVGGSLQGGDITPDGKYIYVTDAQITGNSQSSTNDTGMGVIHKVSLTDGTVTNLSYPLSFYEEGGVYLAIAANGKAFFDGDFAGSGWVPLRQIDLSTDTISTASGGHGSVRQNTTISHSADRRLLFFAESNISSGPTFTYDAQTDTFAHQLDTNSFDTTTAVNHDGSLIAMLSGQQITDSSLTAVHSLSTAGRVAFDPYRNVLYQASTATNTINVYDTNTWNLLRSIPTDEVVQQYIQQYGAIQCSADDSKLFLGVPDGVRIYSLATGSAAFTTTLAASAATAAFGQPVTFTVTAAGANAAPTGLATLLDGATILGSASFTNGVASITVDDAAVGNHQIVAFYPGDDTLAARNSAPIPLTITPLATSSAFNAAPTALAYGASITFSATVSPADPSLIATGTVDFTDATSATLLGSAPLAQGVATLILPALPGGSYSIIAAYRGNGTFLPSTSSATAVNVAAANTWMSLTSSGPAAIGFPATLTASVHATGNQLAPTGAIQLLEGTTILASSTLNGGTATFSTAGLSAGTHNLSLAYAGDNSFLPATAFLLTELVAPAPAVTAIALVPSTATPSFGQTVTLTATVTADNGATPPGSITFFDGTATLGYASLQNGVAVYSAKGLSVGNHAITAHYALTQNLAFASSDSPLLSLTVTPAATSAALTISANTLGFSQPLLLTATVASAGGIPTGTVTFFDGTTTLGIATLDSTGAAVLTTSTLGLGPHTLSASYGGFTNFAASNASAVQASVQTNGTTTTLGTGLAAAAMIPTTGVSDLIFDATRNQLDIISGNKIQRYDVASGTIVDTLTVGTALGGGDITPDGHFLYVTETTGLHSGESEHPGTVHKIDLTNDAIADMTFTLPFDVDTPADFVVISNTIGILTTSVNADYSDAAYDVINLATGAVVTGSTASSSGSPRVQRSADRNVASLIVADWILYGSFVRAGSDQLFDAQGNSLKTTPTTGVGNPVLSAVSRDGALHALYLTNSGTVIRDRQDNTVATLPNVEGPLAFDPTANLLYVADTTSRQLLVYDTQAWRQLYRVPLQDNIGAASSTDGLMSVSNDGNELFLATASGVRIYNLHATTFHFGAPVQIMATVASLTPASGPPTGLVTFTDASTGATLGTVPVSNAMAELTLNTLAVGTHQVNASFAGNAGFYASNSLIQTLTITSADTTTLLSEAAPGATPQPPTLVATVSSSGGTPDGSVTFMDGATILGTVPLTNGSATFNYTTYSSATPLLTAIYHGNARFAGSTSSALSQVFGTTTTLLPPPTPPEEGIPFTLNVAVTSIVPGVAPTAGTVSIAEGTNILATAPLSNGVAQFTLTLAAGLHSLSAAYSGGAGFMPSAAPSVPVTVQTKTTTALTLERFAQAVTLTAHVVGVVPGQDAGVVTFCDGTTNLGSAPLGADGGEFTATFTAITLSKGSHAFAAIYQGNAGCTGSTSSSLSYLFQPAPVIDLLAVYTSTAASTEGGTQALQNLIVQAVQQTNQAFLNSAINATIRLVDIAAVNYSESGDIDTDMNNLQNGQIAGVSALRDKCGADLVTMFTSAGTISGSDVILGEGDELRNLLGSNDSQLAYSVIVAPSALADYTLAHELGHNLGAMHDVQNANSPGAYAYSYGWRFTGNDGNVYHDIMSYDPGQVIPYYSNPAVSYQGVPTGTTTANNALTINQTAPLVATYRTAVVPLTVSSSTTLTGDQTGVQDTALTFNVTVTPDHPDGDTPTGVVTFMDGRTVLGAAGLNNQDQATFTTTQLAAGVHNITAVYAGAGYFTASTSAVLPLTIMEHTITDSQMYLQQLYVDVLHRPLDPTGQTVWMNTLQAGATFHDVAMDIVGSREYDGDVIDGYYVQYLGRHAETAGLNGWVDLMQTGLNADQIRAGILGSDEYFARVGGNNTTWINSLYNTFLNRNAEPAGLAYWLTQLTTDPATRQQVSAGIANADETRQDLIDSYYANYLGRTPDTPGLTMWMADLAQGISQPAIVAAFVTAPEYLAVHGIV